MDGGERSKRRMAAATATEPPRIKEQLLLILLHFLLLLAFKSEKYYEREEEEMRETGRVRMRKEERRGVEDGERGGKFASFMHIFSLPRKLACHFCQRERERERKEGHSPPSYMLRTVHLLPACTVSC